MWDEFEKSVTVEKAVGKALRKPTKAALDAFEKSYRVALPTSYREFVRKFGPGELSKYVRIYAPGYGASHPADLERFVKLIKRVSDTLIETYGNAPLIMRMVAFADTVGGDVIAWDPAQVTDQALHEYKIILFPDEGGRPVPAASTFPELVDVCLTKSFGKIIKSKSWKPIRSFTPFSE